MLKVWLRKPRLSTKYVTVIWFRVDVENGSSTQKDSSKMRIENVIVGYKGKELSFHSTT